MVRSSESFEVNASLAQIQAVFEEAADKFHSSDTWRMTIGGALTKTFTQGWGLRTRPATIEIRIAETASGCHISLDASAFGYGPFPRNSLRKTLQEWRAAVEYVTWKPPLQSASGAEPALDQPGRAASGSRYRLFVSYRREDSADVTGRICDALEREFGADAIFRDVDSVPLGVDFRAHIGAAIQGCDVVLAVIGRNWAGGGDSGASRRIDDPADFVRVELESAMEGNIPVIPLVVNRAVMPRADQLPTQISALAYRNGMPIRHDPDFRTDVARLCKQLRDSIPSHSQ